MQKGTFYIYLYKNTLQITLLCDNIYEYKNYTMLSVNQIIKTYKNSNMNKELLSYKLKDYYNLNENDRIHILYYIK